MSVLIKELLQIVGIFILPLIWSVYQYRKTVKNPREANKYFFESIPQIFPTIGIMCTFFGIAYGLWKFDISDVERSLPELMNGLKTAFFASIGGVLLLIISSRFIEYRQWENEKGQKSDETIALNKLLDLMSEMRADIKNNANGLNEIFIFTDENRNRIQPATILKNLHFESTQQTAALKRFSTDLADTISMGFEKLILEQNTLNTIPYIEKLKQEIIALSNKQDKMVEEFKTTMSLGFNEVVGQQRELSTIPHLEKLTHEIEAFGSKQKDSTSEMTQNVAKDISTALGKMIDEFKDSMSGNTKTEFENLANLLNTAGNTLIDFPVQIQSMTNNLNNNFRDLQQVVQQIAKQTLSQTEETTGTMKRQVEDMSDVFRNISQQTLAQSEESTIAMKNQVAEMSEILKNKVGDLQVGQEILINKQTENLGVSAKLLEVFNSSIGKMNGLSVEVNETIKKFDKVQNELNIAAGQLKSVSENVNTTTETIKKTQTNLSEQSNQFLSANKETIVEIQNSLSRAKDVSADYAQKFSVIEIGLQSIFDQIHTGLVQYNKTIGSSLEEYLGKYSEALTSTVGSLAGQSAKHEEMLSELTEQVSQLTKKRN